MNAGEDALSPAAAWAEMSVHLAWGNGLCLCFLFADSSAALAQVRQLATDAWQMKIAPVTIVAPATPTGAAEKILTDLAACQQRMGQVKAPVWVEILTVDVHGSLEWDATRATILARLNEAREQALQRLERATGAQTLARQRDVLVATGNLGDAYFKQAQNNDALVCFRETLALARQLHSALGDEQHVLDDLAVSLGKIGDAELIAGRSEAALTAYSESLTLRRKLRARLGDKPDVLRNLAISLNKIGESDFAAGRNESALTNYRESLTLLRQLHGSLGDTPQALRDLSSALERIANAELAGGRNEIALAAHRESLALARQLHASLGDTPQTKTDLASALENLRITELALTPQPRPPLMPGQNPTKNES